jgi:hypothetical protein
LRPSVGRLAAVDATRLAVEAHLADLDAEQRTIDEDERAAWATWAAQAPDGDPPKPLTERRAALSQKRTLASGDMANAINAGHAVAPRLEALNAEIASIAGRISAAQFAAKLADAMRAVIALHEQMHRHAAALSKANAEMYGFDRALTELHISASDDARIHIQNARVQFNGLKGPSLAVAPGAIEGYAATWRGRLR